MRRLIYADSAINEISRFVGYLDDDMILRLQIALKRLPTIDAVPVVHGHWVYKWNPYFKQTLPFCSVCETVSPSVRETDYCPRCGAKMDEVTE